VAGEELTSRQRPLAFRLDLKDSDGASACRDRELVAPGCENRSGWARRRFATNGRTEQDEAISLKRAERMRPGMKAANSIVNSLC
jgi:hypothetical protein